jgi:hypothetical protein
LNAATSLSRVETLPPFASENSGRASGSAFLVGDRCVLGRGDRLGTIQMQEHAAGNETGATPMVFKTIDVDGLKVFRREGAGLAGALRHRDRLRASTLGAGYDHVFRDFRSPSQ